MSQLFKGLSFKRINILYVINNLFSQQEYQRLELR